MTQALTKGKQRSPFLHQSLQKLALSSSRRSNLIGKKMYDAGSSDGMPYL